MRCSLNVRKFWGPGVPEGFPTGFQGGPLGPMGLWVGWLVQAEGMSPYKLVDPVDLEKEEMLGEVIGSLARHPVTAASYD